MNYLSHVHDINDITRNRNMAKCNMKGKLLDSLTSFFNNKFHKIDKTSICTKLTFLNPKLEEKQSKIKFKIFPKLCAI